MCTGAFLGWQGGGLEELSERGDVGGRGGWVAGWVDGVAGACGARSDRKKK